MFLDPLHQPMIDAQRNPFFIGCSGGGGHNAAIDAIIRYMQAANLVDKLPSYEPIPDYKKNKNDFTRREIHFAARLTQHLPLLTKMFAKSPWPVLPSKNELKIEIDDLLEKNKAPRRYVDMLLDVYPAGFQSVAVWNILQRADKTNELHKLITLQNKADKNNYKSVKGYFLNALIVAEQKMQPYTEIISSQAMGLPALCDAVKEYNDYLKHKRSEAPNIKILQFLTDLPTSECVNFLPTLSHLNRRQREQMHLFGVDLDSSVIEQFHLNHPPFAGLYRIHPKNNPMIRPGFKEPGVNNYQENHVVLTVDNPCLEDKIEQIVVGKEKLEKVAAVMLGSQASDDTIHYAKKLAEHGYDKIFIFGGQTKKIKDELHSFIKQNPCYQDKLVLLANQSDSAMAPILVRSDLIVMRGGGLSVMERMAMPNRPGQQVFFHCKLTDDRQLTSGIKWEDKNVDKLIAYLNAAKVLSSRTSIELFASQLQEIAYRHHFAQQTQSVAPFSVFKPSVVVNDTAAYITLRNDF